MYSCESEESEEEEAEESSAPSESSESEEDSDESSAKVADTELYLELWIITKDTVLNQPNFDLTELLS